MTERTRYDFAVVCCSPFSVRTWAFVQDWFMAGSYGVGMATSLSVFFTLAPGGGTLTYADEVAALQSVIEPEEQSPVLTTDEARRQAKVLHSTIHSTLRVMHDRYYREDEALPIPAAAMGEIFKDIESNEHIKLRWLAVEGQAMNTDHVAQDAFEVKAVNALKSGKPSYEETAENIYRRAAPITLSNHCLKCHMPDRKSTRNRIAGLIIAIPIQQ